MKTEEMKEYIDQFIRPKQKQYLLDYFAGQALIGEIIAEQLWINTDKDLAGRSCEERAIYCYNQANAMLQERTKRIGGQREEEKEKTN